MLQDSNGDMQEAFYSSKNDSTLSSNGQIMWELKFNYTLPTNLNIVYKNAFKDKKVIIKLDDNSNPGLETHNCIDEKSPFSVAFC